MDTKLSQIVGYPPVAGSFGFALEGALIISLALGFNFDEFAPNVYQKFLVWLEENHPDSFGQLYREEAGVSTPILTRDSLDLAVTYLEEYDRSVNG